MPYVSHISLSFRTHILHCLQMLVFFKASGLNVINKTDTSFWKNGWRCDPCGMCAWAPFSWRSASGCPMESSWMSVGESGPAEVGSRLCFPGHLLNPSDEHQTWTARVRQCTPRWPQWMWQCRAVLSPMDDRVALCTLTSIPVSPYGWLPTGLGGGGWAGGWVWMTRKSLGKDSGCRGKSVTRWPSQHCAHPL